MSSSLSSVSDRPKRAFLGGLVTAFLVFLGAWIDNEKGPVPFMRWSYDFPHLFTEPQTLSEAVIVEIPGAENPRNPGLTDRDRIRNACAEILKHLSTKPPPNIAFDIFFDRGFPRTGADTNLSIALQEYSKKGRVVIISEIEAGTRRMDRLEDWFSHFAMVATVDLLKGGDGVVRKTFIGGPPTPTLPWFMAGFAESDLFQTPEGKRYRESWIRYYGKEGPFTKIPLEKALQIDPSAFAHRAVFVGLEVSRNAESKDRYSIPWRDEYYPQHYSGLEVLATIYANTVRKDGLSRLSFLTETLTLVITGFVLGFILCLLRPWAALGMTLVFSVAWISLQFWFFFTQDFWMNWSLVQCLALPGGLVFSLALRFAEVQQRLAEIRGSLPRDAKATPKSISPSPSAHPEFPQCPGYTLVKRVGKGAYGAVYLARDVSEAWCAVKVVERAELEEDSNENAYEREFRGMKEYKPISLGHPGWVQVLHVNKDPLDRYFYYVMETADDLECARAIQPEKYVPDTLRARLRKRGRFPLSECLELGIRLSQALQYLHDHKLLHRDIKPENIIFVDGSPKFVDVGLVTRMRSRSVHHVSQLGTKDYMPPEGPGAVEGDIYGLGILLYVIFTGQEAKDFPNVPLWCFEADAQESFAPMNDLLLKACDPEPLRRFHSAAALCQGLLAVQTVSSR